MTISFRPSNYQLRESSLQTQLRPINRSTYTTNNQPKTVSYAKFVKNLGREVALKIETDRYPCLRNVREGGITLMQDNMRSQLKQRPELNSARQVRRWWQRSRSISRSSNGYRYYLSLITSQIDISNGERAEHSLCIRGVSSVSRLVHHPSNSLFPKHAPQSMCLPSQPRPNINIITL